MPNKINLITGENYSLSEIFSGHRNIIIPDLQRDYCWGKDGDLENRCGLVYDFLTSLIDQFKERGNFERLNLGLIYGYEAPVNFVQLCDGQQRITTLFLLMGMLNRWSDRNIYRRYLISDFNYLEDDRQPYLRYAIRESSLYFLSDLTCNFFITGNAETLARFEDIRSSGWYYGEYDDDFSVISMMHALEIINSRKTEICELGIEEFGNFVTERLNFIYYDMGSREQGEETFVIINTTGEPLTATENLKPLTIGKMSKDEKDRFSAKYGETPVACWERIETWFWQNRNKSNFDTADYGLTEFLRWIFLAENYRDGKLPDEKNPLRKTYEDTLTYPDRFRCPPLSIETILLYYNAFIAMRNRGTEFPGATCLNICNYGNGEVLSQIDCFTFIPLLKYRKENPQVTDLEYRRFVEFLTNLSLIPNVRKSVNSLVAEAVCMLAENGTLGSLFQNSDKYSETLITPEELRKQSIIANSPDAEAKFWIYQAMKVDSPKSSLFQGEISVAIDWATDDNDNFDLSRFVGNYDKLTQIFKSGSAEANDVTRRLMLAFHFCDYPYNNRTLGYEQSWKDIIVANKHLMPFFINLASNENGRRLLIDKAPRKDIIHWYLIRYPQLLGYSNKKNLYYYYDVLSTVTESRKRGIPIPIGALMLELGWKDLNTESPDIKDSTLKFDMSEKTIYTITADGRVEVAIWAQDNEFIVRFKFKDKKEGFALHHIQFSPQAINKVISLIRLDKSATIPYGTKCRRKRTPHQTRHHNLHS